MTQGRVSFLSLADRMSSRHLLSFHALEVSIPVSIEQNPPHLPRGLGRRLRPSRFIDLCLSVGSETRQKPNNEAFMGRLQAPDQLLRC